MATDLSTMHHLVSDLFRWPASAADWDQYRLSEAQVQHFRSQGFLAGIRVLDERQVDALCSELDGLADPNLPGHELFYEFHTNESTIPIRCYSTPWVRGALHPVSMICYGTRPF